MKDRWTGRLALVFSLAMLPGGGALVTAQEQEEEPAKREVPHTQATVERIMDQAVINISRRYNLNEEQKNYTQELMHREVLRFLREHEKDVWPVIRDLLAAQFEGKPPEDPGQMARVGKAALPLFELAKKAILDANREWRQFLSAEQVQLHDRDLADMEFQFAQIQENLRLWADGKATQASVFPPPDAQAMRVARPKRPEPGLPDPVLEEIPALLGVFEALADRFIKEHPDLDQGQLDSVRSILDEFKAKGSNLKIRHEADLKRIKKTWREALRNRDREAVVKAEQERKQVLEPFLALTDEMETRLDSLLTTAQRERYAQRTKEGGDSTGTAPAQPAAPKPPAEGTKGDGAGQATPKPDAAKQDKTGASNPR